MENNVYNNPCKNEKITYIKDLEVLIFLLDKKLFIELLNKIHLAIPMNKMVE